MADYIVFDQVDFYYNKGTPFEKKVLTDISLSIPRNKVTAIIGHTGSGKSTLIQHLNVLNRPTKGTITIDGEVVTNASKNTQLKPLRKKVGVVFQFPEAQLFEEAVLKDVMFGPLNFGASTEEAQAIAREKLALVGVSEDLHERSPFDLSGGQKRRVAIAGVLALNPQVLVLDEPTAGLDPLGHKQMMEMFIHLHQQEQMTLIMVTHQMEDVAQFADHVIVLDKGQIAKIGKPEDIFADQAWLLENQLTLPYAMDFYLQLLEKLGMQGQPVSMALTPEDLAPHIIQLKAVLKNRGNIDV